MFQVVNKAKTPYFICYNTSHYYNLCGNYVVRSHSRSK